MSRRDGGYVEPVVQRVVHRDLTSYGRRLRIPELPGLTAVSERAFAKDLKACAGTSNASEFEKNPILTTGKEHPQFVWALETATFAQADADDEFALCPPAKAMEQWIQSRSHATSASATGTGARDGANSSNAPGGAPVNALNVSLTLKQRVAVVSCRREERDGRYFELRKKYVSLLRQCMAEHREQVGAVKSLRAALHRSGISPDSRLSRSQLERRVGILNGQVQDLRRRLRSSRGSASSISPQTPVFAAGEEVTTPFGDGVVVQQRDADGIVAVRLAWAATAHMNPSQISLKDPKARRSGQTPARRQKGNGDAFNRTNKRKLFKDSSILDGNHGGSSTKVARLRESGRSEALAAVMSESDYEQKRMQEALNTAEVYSSSHHSHPARGVALRLDPVRGHPTLGFYEGVRGDGGSPRRSARPHTGARTPMSPAARLPRNRSFNTPAVAFEELQKLKAEVQRLKWQLKQAEEERQEQRASLTEARESRELMLREMNSLRSELAAERHALEEQMELTKTAQQNAVDAKEALSEYLQQNNIKPHTPRRPATMPRADSMSAMVQAAEAAEAAEAAATRKTRDVVKLRLRGVEVALGDDEDEEMGFDNSGEEGATETQDDNNNDEDEDEDEDEDDDEDDGDAKSSEENEDTAVADIMALRGRGGASRRSRSRRAAASRSPATSRRTRTRVRGSEEAEQAEPAPTVSTRRRASRSRRR